MNLLYLGEATHSPYLKKEYLREVPEQEFWHYGRKIQLTDVPIWEEVYYSPGVLGIYAAWSPLAEYYIIVIPTMHFSNNADAHVETFYGPDAARQTWLRAKELGVNLDLYRHWVDDVNTWLTDETMST